MDSFTEYIQKFWGKVSVAQTAIAMKLHEATIVFWQSFVMNFMVDRIRNGQPLPTPDEIIAEWRKDHPPAHYVATPFGSDTPQPISSALTPDSFIAELKALILRYNI